MAAVLDAIFIVLLRTRGAERIRFLPTVLAASTTHQLEVAGGAVGVAGRNLAVCGRAHIDGLAIVLNGVDVVCARKKTKGSFACLD